MAAGNSFHITFRFATDQESKARILAILGNRRTFDSGPLGQGHLKDVGCTARSDASDFRSVRGELGPMSLEVMINRTSFLGYADLDKYNLYGGLAPAFADVFFAAPLACGPLTTTRVIRTMMPRCESARCPDLECLWFANVRTGGTFYV